MDFASRTIFYWESGKVYIKRGRVMGSIPDDPQWGERDCVYDVASYDWLNLDYMTWQ
jgi:hypothetical protein